MVINNKYCRQGILVEIAQQPATIVMFSVTRCSSRLFVDTSGRDLGPYSSEAIARILLQSLNLPGEDTPDAM